MTNFRPILISALALLLAGCHEAIARSAGTRRALLIGINDYSASALGPRAQSNLTERDWPNLRGAVRDVDAMEQLLVDSYGFQRRDIVKLTDQQATRKAILESIDQHLVSPVAAGDVVFFYFAGHGSQVKNSLSDEPDLLDESIVPADSRSGAKDIRDKELRSYFNRILEQRASLTILLDSCHSASGARTPDPGAIARGIAPDTRDVADATDYGPRPEERGALVLAATQDFDRAFEKRDEKNQSHGAFSWAWLRAARKATSTESAGDTFQRAHALMAAEMPWQEPVLGGSVAAQRAPFLHTRIDDGRDRVRVAVERISSDGTVTLNAGWADGLSVGTTLRVADRPRDPARLVVTAISDLGRSTARMLSAERSTIGPGTLLEAPQATRNAKAWMRLESPRTAPWIYTLGIRAKNDEAWVTDAIIGGQCYEPVLRARSELLADPGPRYVYFFVVDSAGRSTLLYPRNGSVENRLPFAAKSRPRTISLGRTAAFCGAEPYGIDTYILLTTDEPLANPFSLQWNGGRGPLASSAELQELLGSAQWSVERLSIESRAPQTSPRGVSSNDLLRARPRLSPILQTHNGIALRRRSSEMTP